MNRRRRWLVALGGSVVARAALSQPASNNPRIALVDAAEQVANMSEGRHPYWGALLGELRQLGHIEGKTISVERWSGGGDTGAYSALARQVVASRPQVIVARGRSIIAPLASATEEIPIVAIGTISSELRASLAHPGKNLTGLHVSSDDQQLYSKPVEFLRGVTKANARIAWLGPRSLWDGPAGEAAREGARQMKLALEPVIVASPVDESAIRRAFTAMGAGRFDGLIVSPATEIFPHRAVVARLALELRLPSVAIGRALVVEGVLMSYGPATGEQWRRAAHYVDKILKGAKPGDLPIELPTTIEFVINLKTARALGLTIPQSLRLRADEVIE